MDAVKANNLSYLSINQTDSGKQKTSEKVCNSHTKTALNKPAFGASLHVNENLGKKTFNLILNGIDKIQKYIESGGFIREFLIVDFAGMIIPRVYQAYHRNEEELGHPNYKAAKEEFTREILSGPSMFIIPMSFLAASKKIFGSASHVKLDILKKFREITGSVIENKKNKDLARSFYHKVVHTLYGSVLDKNAKNEIVEDFLKLHNANPKEARALKSKVAENLISINKKIGNNKNLGISLADSSSINFKGISKNVSDFVEDCRNYSSDVIKALSSAGTEAGAQLLNKIHDFKEGARKLITTTAVATMSAFLMYIPKLYNQNKEYPGLAGLKDNPAKDENKLMKGASEK